MRTGASIPGTLHLPLVVLDGMPRLLIPDPSLLPDVRVCTDTVGGKLIAKLVSGETCGLVNPRCKRQHQDEMIRKAANASENALPTKGTMRATYMVRRVVGDGLENEQSEGSG